MKREPVIFGFWVFLMADLVLFAILFATYASMSVQGQAGGPSPTDVFDLPSAFIETMLLLSSSITFGMASLALKYKADRLHLVFWLVLTFCLGAGFIGMEVRDFWIMTQQGAVPQRSGFLSAFFLLVATHGIHVTAGLLLDDRAAGAVAGTGSYHRGETATDASRAVLAHARYRVGLYFHLCLLIRGGAL